MALIFYLLIIMPLCFGSIRFFKRIYNPIFNLTFFSTISVLLSYTYSEMDNYISTGIIWYGVGLLLFSLGFYLANFSKTNNPQHNTYPNLVFINKLTNICCVCEVLSLLLSVYVVYQLCGNLLLVFIDSNAVRALYLERSVPFYLQLLGWLLSCNIYMSIAVFPIAIKNHLKNSKLKFLIVVFLELLGSMFTKSKLAFITAVVVILSLFSVTAENKEIEKRMLLKYGKWLFLLIIVLLLIVVFQRGYVESGRSDSYSDAIISAIGSYMIIPFESFSYLVDIGYNKQTMGGLCFRPFINILATFGVGEKTSSVQDVIDGTSGNVYSMFGDFFLDFSYIGIITLSLLFGFLLGKLYKRKVSNNIGNIAINSLINMFMVLAFYDFQFIQTIFLISIIYICVFSKVFKTKIYLNR